MRFRVGSSVIYPLLLGFTVSTGLVFNAGCGGGSSNPPPSPTPTPTGSGSPTPTPTPLLPPVPLKSTIVWGPRSRQVLSQNEVSGPSSALSAVLRLAGASSNGGDFTQTLNRDVLNGRQDYNSSPAQVRPGVYNLTVTFHANAGAQGQVVGTAAASATVLADGSLTTTIATFGTIQRVTVLPNQSVNINETKTVVYETRDNAGNLVAVTPGSGFVNLVDATSTVNGQPSATVQGELITGVNPTQAVVTVKVDDAVSSPTSITVRSFVNITAVPNPATVSILLSQQFTPTITNDGPAGANGVTYQVKEGAAAGSVTATGLFTATRSEGPFTLVIRSVYDPNVFIEVPITVTSLVGVTIDPSTFTMSIKDQKQFVASVSNIPPGDDETVTWEVVGGNANGSITSDGLYTAPATPGDYTILARSRFDTRKTATATVFVRSFVNIVVAPTPVTLSIRETREFTATVTGVPNDVDTSVTWSAPDGGTLATSGPASVEFTAPDAPGTYRLRATSNFDPATSTTINVKVSSGGLNVGIK